jgi:hypothetical protein
MSKTMVIEGLLPGDITFESDRGTWNVSKALRDVEAGLFKAYTFSVDETVEASRNVVVDEARIDQIVQHGVLEKMPPLIFIVEDGRLWLIDGHHRVHALQRLGHSQCVGFVIEDPEPYRVLFNGARVAPWMRGKH